MRNDLDLDPLVHSTLRGIDVGATILPSPFLRAYVSFREQHRPSLYFVHGFTSTPRITLTMGGPNIQVSNGTCYSASGEQMDPGFLPCGNDFYGHRTCCWAGDNCLLDNACFGIHGSGDGSFLTYLAGCSDPDFADASCPNKGPIAGESVWT